MNQVILIAYNFYYCVFNSLPNERARDTAIEISKKRIFLTLRRKASGYLTQDLAEKSGRSSIIRFEYIASPLFKTEFH